MTTTVEKPVNGVKFTPAPLPDGVMWDLTPDEPEAAEADVEAAPSRLDRLAARTAAIRADWSSWWLRTVNPPNLDAWWAARLPHRIPDDNDRLRAAWRIDFAVTGSLLAGVSVLLFLTAAGVRWTACHPARRWLFLALAAATVGMWLA